jgi:hypothetical protein
MHKGILKMEHSATVSCDVQRVFSYYKKTLVDNRREFVFQTLMHHNVTLLITSKYAILSYDIPILLFHIDVF